jgi:hypothetical protein
MTAFPWGTVAVVMRISTTLGGGSYMSIVETDAASDDALAFFVDGDNGARMSTYNGTGGAVNGAAGQGLAIADGWVMTAWTKATGTVTPRFHRYRWSADDMSHAAAGATSPDPALTVTGIKLGANHTNADAFDGDIAAVMFLPKYVMGDGEIDRLPRGRWREFVDGAGPGFLVEYGRNDSPVLGGARDISRGRARESAITGTSRATSVGPSGFAFSLPGRRAA